jgi:cytochrome c oxidase accessory protein FixG
MVQYLLLAAIILIPFLSINSHPALRMDIGQRTFFLAGAAVRIDQFYLVLLLTLVMGAGFLLLTVVLGRVWCGWLCPQTVFNDLSDQFQDLLLRRFPKQIKTIGAHFFAILLASFVSINLICWFMAPGEVLKSIATPGAHPVIAVCFSAVTIMMYLNLALVKRGFCRSYCPYGRFQAALLDSSTLNLAFLEETRDRCVRCDACVRVCPMEIDIRKGFQIECINCGRCIDACRGVMGRLNNADGLIAYRFGEDSGSSPRLGSKAMILTLLLCFLSAALVWGLYVRSDTAFSVQRVSTVETRTFPDGSQVQAWRAIIGNRGQSATLFSLGISPLPGVKAELLGPVNAIKIAPNENRQVSFFIRYNRSAPVHQPFELRLLREDILIATIPVKP